MSRFATRFSGLALLAPLAATLIAACGSGGGNGGNANLSGNSGAQVATASHKQAVRFAECMRANGVPQFPDPGSGGQLQLQASKGPNGRTLKVNGVPVSTPAFEAAQQKCQKFMPQGPPMSAAQIARIRKQALRMARCMRAHGVPNFPDPKITTGPGGHGIGIEIGGPPGSGQSGFDPQSPAFQAAMQKCSGGPRLFKTQAAG
jgi:hypothetical protein